MRCQLESCAKCGSEAYLLEDLDNDPEEIPEEELVTEGDSSSDVTEGEGSSVLFGVREVVCASNHDANHVQGEHEGEQLRFRSALASTHRGFPNVTYHTIVVVPDTEPQQPARRLRAGRLHALRQGGHKVAGQRLVLIFE